MVQNRVTALAGGTVYIGGLYDPNLYALNPSDGSVKWACSFKPVSGEDGGWPFTSPVVGGDGTIYQTLLYDSRLYAIKPDTGSILWATDLLDLAAFGVAPDDLDPDAAGWSEPVLGPDGVIYVSLDDPYLRAVDPNGMFIRGDKGTPGYWWVKNLSEEHKDWKRTRIWFCPAASGPVVDEKGHSTQRLTIFRAWGIFQGAVDVEMVSVLQHDRAVDESRRRPADGLARVDQILQAILIPAFPASLRGGLRGACPRRRPAFRRYRIAPRRTDV